MLERLNAGFDKWFNPITKFMSHISSVILFLMMLLTILDVLLRKLFNKSLMGTVEVTEFMLVILIFFALAYAEVFGSHVKVDVVMAHFSKRVQCVFDMVTQFICAILGGMITWSTMIYASKIRISGEVSQDLWIPIFPFVYVCALGCAILSLTLLANVFKSLSGVIKS